jgi:hypothetical protein
VLLEISGGEIAYEQPLNNKMTVFSPCLFRCISQIRIPRTLLGFGEVKEIQISTSIVTPEVLQQMARMDKDSGVEIRTIFF